MKPYKKSKIARTTMYRKEYKIASQERFIVPWYIFEEIYYYSNMSKTNHRKNGNRNKQIFRFQVRMYKTWKHNRKTQYKEYEKGKG